MSRRQRSPCFHFKQFSVVQHQAAMRVTTHACVFGALIDVEGATRILDIGTGTGLLSLMLAQRCDAAIDAVELDRGACDDATHNFIHSPWAVRLQLFPQSFQDFCADKVQKYSHIVSNPPFFAESLGSNDDARLLARHDVALPLATLLPLAQQKLQEDGKLWLLLPDIAEKRLRREAAPLGLHISQRIALCNIAGRAVNRWVFCLEQHAKPERERTLVIYSPHPHYSSECLALLKPYYASL